MRTLYLVQFADLFRFPYFAGLKWALDTVDRSLSYQITSEEWSSTLDNFFLIIQNSFKEGSTITDHFRQCFIT